MDPEIYPGWRATTRARDDEPSPHAGGAWTAPPRPCAVGRAGSATGRCGESTWRCRTSPRLQRGDPTPLLSCGVTAGDRAAAFALRGDGRRARLRHLRVLGGGHAADADRADDLPAHQDRDAPLHGRRPFEREDGEAPRAERAVERPRRSPEAGRGARLG